MGERRPSRCSTPPRPAAWRSAVPHQHRRRRRGQAGDVRLSRTGWRLDAAKPARRRLLRRGRAVAEFCPALGIAIPVGKDSLSMRTAGAGRRGARRGGRASVADRLRVRAGRRRARTLTPQLRRSAWRDRAAADRPRSRPQPPRGSALAQVSAHGSAPPPDLDDACDSRRLRRAARTAERRPLLAYHDRCRRRPVRHAGRDGLRRRRWHSQMPLARLMRRLRRAVPRNSAWCMQVGPPDLDRAGGGLRAGTRRRRRRARRSADPRLTRACDPRRRPPARRVLGGLRAPGRATSFLMRACATIRPARPRNTRRATDRGRRRPRIAALRPEEPDR